MLEHEDVGLLCRSMSHSVSRSRSRSFTRSPRYDGLGSAAANGAYNVHSLQETVIA